MNKESGADIDNRGNGGDNNAIDKVKENNVEGPVEDSMDGGMSIFGFASVDY